MEKDKILYVLNDPIVSTGRAIDQVLQGDKQATAALKTGIPQPKFSEFARRRNVDVDMLASVMIRYNVSFWEICPITQANDRPGYIEDGEHEELYRGFRADDAVKMQMALVDIHKKLRETIPLNEIGNYDLITEEKNGEIIFRFKPKSQGK